MAEASVENKVVLVVEDDAQVALLIKFKLDKSGCQVILAENGEAALALIREKPPDLVILDIMMPVMDGHEMLRIIKADPATSMVPVIILTARGMEADILKGFELGAIDYIVKPFSLAELMVRVTRSLSSAG